MNQCTFSSLNRNTAYTFFSVCFTYSQCKRIRAKNEFMITLNQCFLYHLSYLWYLYHKSSKTRGNTTKIGDYIKYFRSETLINRNVFEIRFLMNIIYIKEIDRCIMMPTQTYCLLYCETSFIFVASF